MPSVLDIVLHGSFSGILHLEFCLSLVSSVQPFPLVPGSAPAAHPGTQKMCCFVRFPLLCSLLAQLFSSLLLLVSGRLTETLKPSSLATQSPAVWGLSPLLSLPPPVSVHANPRESGGHLPGTRPLLPVPIGVWGVTGGKAGRTQGQPTDCRAVVGDHSCHHLPSGARNHCETQVAEGGPDMPLCLSPVRLDGPHLSCLVSWSPPGYVAARHGPWELTLLRSFTSGLSVQSLPLCLL